MAHLPALAVGLALATSLACGTSYLNKSLADWRRDLDKGDAAARRAAAFAIGRLGAEAGDAVEALAQAARADPDEGVRAMTATAVGDVVLATRNPRAAWERAGKRLIEVLVKDQSPSVRRGAAYALGVFGETAAEARPTLTQALRDKQASVRQNAAWALGRAGNAASVPDLCERLGDEAVLVRRDAASALGQLSARLGRQQLRGAARPLLALARAERDAVVRKSALGALAAIADETHRAMADELAALLQDKDREAARSAAFALGNMGGPAARRAMSLLRESLTDSDPGVQALAAAVLANAGDVAVVEDLARALKASKSPEVRRNCAIAITRLSRDVRRSGGRIDGIARSSLGALVEGLRPVGEGRASEEAREAAAEAIANIQYPENKEALPAVREILRADPNQTLRQRCVWALFCCADLDQQGLTPVLAKVLEETGSDSLMVRYDVARVLAAALGERAPDRVAETLVHMVGNPKLRVFEVSGAAIEGVPSEGKAAASRATAVKGGDARYMAADALRQLGAKASNNPAVIDALRQAAKDDEPALRQAARRALGELTRAQ